MKQLVTPSFSFGAKNGSPAFGMATRSWFGECRYRWYNSCVILKKYAVPRQIKPGIFKLTTRGGQSNLRTV